MKPGVPPDVEDYVSDQQVYPDNRLARLLKQDDEKDRPGKAAAYQ